MLENRSQDKAGEAAAPKAQGRLEEAKKINSSLSAWGHLGAEADGDHGLILVASCDILQVYNACLMCVCVFSTWGVLFEDNMISAVLKDTS